MYGRRCRNHPSSVMSETIERRAGVKTKTKLSSFEPFPPGVQHSYPASLPPCLPVCLPGFSSPIVVTRLLLEVVNASGPAVLLPPPSPHLRGRPLARTALHYRPTAQRPLGTPVQSIRANILLLQYVSNVHAQSMTVHSVPLAPMAPHVLFSFHPMTVISFYHHCQKQGNPFCFFASDWTELNCTAVIRLVAKKNY